MSPLDSIASVAAYIEAAGKALLGAADEIEHCYNMQVDSETSHTASGADLPAPVVAMDSGKTSTVAFISAVTGKIRDQMIDMLKKALFAGASEQLPDILQILEEHEQLMGIFAAKAETQAITPSEDREHDCFCCFRVLIKTDVDPVLASILDYNGRSLDSHNPWHLHESYEEHLRRIEEHPDPDPIISGPDTINWYPEAFEPAAPIVGEGHKTKQKSIFHTMEDRPVSPIEPQRKDNLYEESKERTGLRQSAAPAILAP